MKRAGPAGRDRAPAFCRWVDVVGRNPAQLERVRKRLTLPPRLVTLSLVEHLQSTVIPVRPAWFIVTYFTTLSRRRVFTCQPLYLWLGHYALVTISPWARRRSILGAVGELDETRDDFLCRVLDAAVHSHEDVLQQLNEAFFAHDNGLNPHAWHQKERRLTLFAQLLAHQLDFLCAIGLENAKVRRVHGRLSGLVQIARYADRKLRQSGYCQVCSRNDTIGYRRGH
jgi:hypothetical protein